MMGMYSRADFAWSFACTCQYRSPASRKPFGRLALVDVIAVRTSSKPIPSLLRSVGFSSTRTAGSDPPPTVTWPTPFTCDRRCARLVEAMSYIWPGVKSSEVSARIITGASAGFTLR